MNSTRLFSMSRLRSALAALICICGAIAAAAPAAAGVKFGPDENLRRIEDVRLQNSSKEALFIGHKVTFYWIGLPFAFSDDGYILGVKGKSVYYPVDKERLAEWQAQGLLPNPLPTYELKTADYVFGHLLWIVLAGWAIWTALRALVTKRRKKSVSAVPVAASVPPAARVAQAVGGGQQPLKPAAVPPPPHANSAPEKTAVAEKSMANPTAASVPPTQAVQQRPAPRQPAAQLPATQRVAPTATQMRAEAAKLPVAKTVCRVKAIKAA